jgi:hypothetical protein
LFDLPRIRDRTRRRRSPVRGSACRLHGERVVGAGHEARDGVGARARSQGGAVEAALVGAVAGRASKGERRRSCHRRRRRRRDEHRSGPRCRALRALCALCACIAGRSLRSLRSLRTRVAFGPLGSGITRSPRGPPLSLWPLAPRRASRRDEHANRTACQTAPVSSHGTPSFLGSHGFVALARARRCVA